MSIASQLERIINAKASLKSAIEGYFNVSIPSSDHLEDYVDYFIPQGCYNTPPQANGVYIKYVGGKYSDYNMLWAGQTPMGVALRTSNTAFVIHPTIIHREAVTSAFNASLTQYRSSSNAITDYSGKSNTEVLANSGYASTAIQYVKSGPFADGSNGFLASAGQLEAIRLNYSTILSAANLIGGLYLETTGTTPQFTGTNKCSFFSTTYYGYWSSVSSYMYWIWYVDDGSPRWMYYNNGVGNMLNFVLGDF